MGIFDQAENDNPLLPFSFGVKKEEESTDENVLTARNILASLEKGELSDDQHNILMAILKKLIDHGQIERMSFFYSNNVRYISKREQ